MIRSLGGWSQVLSVRGRGGKIASDERILGSGEFVEGLLSEVEKKEKETLRLRRKAPSLTALMQTVISSQEKGIREDDLRSGDRRRELVKIRRLFCQLAVRGMGYSGAEVARYLGVTTSAVNRLSVFKEIPDFEKYLKLF